MKLETENIHVRDSDILFEEESHTYSYKGKQFLSVTTWVNTFFDEFNSNDVLKKMMKSINWKNNIYYGKTEEEIKSIWKKNNIQAIENGVKLHRDIELFYNNEKIDNNSIEFDYFKNFFRDHYYLTPWRTEWKVYDEDIHLAGTIDMVFRKSNGKFVLYDWKRCKQIYTHNQFKKFAKIDFLKHLADTNYMHYCLQLNLYKYVLEKKYNVLVDSMYLVCLHPNNKNKNYLLYKVPLMELETLAIYNHIASNKN